MSQLSRRRFLLRLAALACSAIAGRSLVACRPAPDPTATSLPPTETPLPAPSTTPTFAPPPPRPEVIRFHPDTPSTVVHARHSGVWQGEDLFPGALRQMLDASITALTGLRDARAAWAALFRPNERIAIKVNAFQNSLVWTHAPLVSALTDCLQDAGVPAEQIVIYDQLNMELKKAGFAVNEDGPGVRCRGNRYEYTAGGKAGGVPAKLCNVLWSCDALINVPILKTHSMSGISFALKNHYGTASSPQSLHSPLSRCIAELNALPAIKDRTRLVIGDALGVCVQQEGSWPYWREAKRGDSILVSYDPVAVDTLGLRLFSEALTANGGDPQWAKDKANAWLKLAAELGVGTNDQANMKLVELPLG